jgi:hypothetical protein
VPATSLLVAVTAAAWVSRPEHSKSHTVNCPCGRGCQTHSTLCMPIGLSIILITARGKKRLLKVCKKDFFSEQIDRTHLLVAFHMENLKNLTFCY